MNSGKKTSKNIFFFHEMFGLGTWWVFRFIGVSVSRCLYQHMQLMIYKLFVSILYIMVIFVHYLYISYTFLIPEYCRVSDTCDILTTFVLFVG